MCGRLDANIETPAAVNVAEAGIIIIIIFFFFFFIVIIVVSAVAVAVAAAQQERHVVACQGRQAQTVARARVILVRKEAFRCWLLLIDDAININIGI